MKGIIYTRVSSEEQVDGTSLDFQEKICREYCKSKGIEILGEPYREEGASAKTTQRKEFLRAIEYCRKNKGNVDAFVVAKVDRFARNTEDHFYVKKLLLDYGVSLHSVTEPIGNSPIGKLIETVLAGTSDFDNAVRKQRCSDGMSSKINEGIWAWKPPIGYECAQNKKHGLKKTTPDEPDKKIFPIIQKGLQEMSLGLHSKARLVRRLDELGLARYRGKPTAPQFVDTLLEENRLKFYAGWLFNPFDKEYRRGLHKPMITDTEVYKIQLILSGKSNSVTHDRHNPTYPLRRSVFCGNCSRPLTGSSSKGNGGVYNYYHCYNKKCTFYGITILKEKLEKDFIKYLTKITPNTEWLAMFRATVIDLWQEKGKSFETDANVYERKLKILTEKRKRIFEMGEDMSYSKEEFKERKSEIDNEIMATKISLSEARIEQFDIESAVIYATNFIQDLGRQWFDLPAQLRQKFQKLVFPEGIYYNKKTGFQTIKLGYIYTLKQQITTRKTTIVDPSGLEPLTSSLQMRRSTS